MPTHLLPAGATPDDIKMAVSQLERLGQTVVATEWTDDGLIVFTDSHNGAPGTVER